MKISDWITVSAIVLGPILAVLAASSLDSYRDRQEEIKARQLNIFRTLMATREYYFLQDHIEALNLIDVEFNKEKEVLAAWRTYHKDLYSSPGSDNQAEYEIWEKENDKLLVKLLYSMAVMLGYDLNETEIGDSSYSPRFQRHIEREKIALRKGMLKVLYDGVPIPMKITNMPEAVDNKEKNEQ